jgi:hypothetical protein
MNAKRVRNVFESGKFCYFYCKAVCLLCITIKKEQGRFHAATTKLDKLSFFIGMLTWILNLIFNTKIKVNHSSIFEIGMLLCCKWSYALPIFVMTGTYLYRYEFFHIVKNFHWIDTKVRKREFESIMKFSKLSSPLQLLKNFIHRDHTRELFWSRILALGNLFYAVLVVIFANVFSVMRGIRFDWFPLDRFFYDSAIILAESFYIIHLFAVYSLHSRMVSIKGMLSSCDDEVKTLINIKLIMKLCEKIHEIILSMNRFFAFNCATLFLQIFMFFILTFFSIYDTYNRDLSLDSISLFLIGTIGYILMTASILLILLVLSSAIRRNYSEIFKKLIKIENSHDSRKIHKITRLATLQIKSSPLVISCGLLTIDWHIWITMFSSILTYVLIIIQFDMSGN